MKTGNPLILVGFIAGFVLAFGGYKYWRATQGWERAKEVAEQPVENYKSDLSKYIPKEKAK